MKILIVNISDVQGGASRAAYRLHRSLLLAGVDSQMLVQSKGSDDYTVIDLASNKIQRGFNLMRPSIDRLPLKLYPHRTKTLFSSSWFGFSDVVERINEIDADIVHLHWICGGMIKIEELAAIKAPIVLSLHDMWSFTGGCHYDEGCGRYESGCGNCKVLQSQKRNDLSKKVFQRKQKSFQKIHNMTVVGLSRWLSDCSQKSALLKNRKHVTLPNPIDTTVFKPFSKAIARELWNLPSDKQLILYGSVGVSSDPRKGFEQLSEALKKLHLKDVELVVFGGSEPKERPDFGFTIHYTGRVHDDVALVTLYNAVDVMVVPSLQENLSNAIMESLSCATPVVAFEIGGNGDMIQHKHNGYLAKPFSPEDLASGIEWVLGYENYDQLAKNAREKVLQEFSASVVAYKYINLYKNILNENSDETN